MRRGLMVMGGAWWAVSRVVGAGLLGGGRGSVPALLASAVAAALSAPARPQRGAGAVLALDLGAPEPEAHA